MTIANLCLEVTGSQTDSPLRTLASSEAESAEPVSILMRAGKVLQNLVGLKVAPDFDEIARRHEITRKHLFKHLRAAAQMSWQHQLTVECKVRDWISLQHSSGGLRAVALLEHVQYDETPLLCRVASNNGIKLVQRSKLFVIDVDWQCIVEWAMRRNNAPSKYFKIRGRRSVSLVPAERCSGEGIEAVLQQSRPPDLDGPHWRYKVRLAEVDAFSGNQRAEGLFMAKRGPTWSHSMQFCMGHKLHKAAESTMTLPRVAKVLSGLIHASLWLTSPQSMPKLRAALLRELTMRPLRISVGTASSAESARHRDRVRRLFSPSPRDQPKRHAFIEIATQQVFNGEWRGSTIEHHCPDASCCPRGREDFMEKASAVLQKITTVLPVETLQRNNWRDWNRGLRCHGFVQAVHGLWSSAFIHAFGPGNAAHEDGDDDGAELDPHPLLGDDPHQQAEAQRGEEDDEAAQKRAELAGHCRAALQLFQTSEWWDELFALLQATEPQSVFMKKLLAWTSQFHEKKEQVRLAETGERHYPIVDLFLGRSSQELLRSSLHLFSSSWWSACDTELNRSELLRITMRSPALVFQLIDQRCGTCPYIMYELVANRSLAVASKLMNIPVCMRDAFSHSILTSVGSAQELLESDDIFELLVASASMLHCSTYSVERAHSGNARAARGQPHTHRKEVGDLGLRHAAWAGPAVFKPVAQQASRSHRPAGRPKKKAAAVARPPQSVADEECVPDSAAAASEQEPKRRRKGSKGGGGGGGGGGAWRAFQSYVVKLQGQPHDWATMKVQYRALDDEQKEFFRQYGLQGCPKAWGLLSLHVAILATPLSCVWS